MSTNRGNHILIAEAELPNEQGESKLTGSSIGGGKVGLDVVVQALSIKADDDNIEIRKMAMKKAIDEASTTVTYIGEAALSSGLSSAVWRIKRLTVSGTVTITEWAGTGVFNQIWNDRTSLTYN
jgi:hypothetical protein